jgi:hypothetical protein
MEDVLGERISPEKTHAFLKGRFLKEPLVNRKTGEIVGETVESIGGMDTRDLSEYIDKVKLFASEYLGVTVREADKNWKQNEAKNRRNKEREAA